jgi:RNA polymerase sigma-70 factor (ECF subfamily)
VTHTVRPAAGLHSAAEAVVVVLAAAGDDAAFAELVRRRQSPIRSLLRRLCGQAALADDLSQ